MRNLVIAVGLVALTVTLPARAQSSFALADLQRIAAEDHPALLSAQGEAAARRGAWLAARRLLNPELTWETGRGEPEDGSPARTLRSLSVSQTFENPLKRHHRLQALAAEADAAAAAADGQALDLAWEVARHYFRVRGLQSSVDIARSTWEAIDRTRVLTAARAELGEVPEREAIRLRVEALRARSDLQAFEATLDLERRHLRIFLGDRLPESFTLAGEESFRPLAASEAELRMRMLADHPTLRAADAGERAARSGLSAARSGRLPDPSISAWSGDELDGRISGVGVSVAIPLWDFNGRTIRYNDDLVTAAEREREATILALRMELALRYTEMRVAEERLRLFEQELLDAAATSFRITEAGYRAGEVSLLEYLDAQRTHQGVLAEHQETLFAWHLSRAALERAVGGEIR